MAPLLRTGVLSNSMKSYRSLHSRARGVMPLATSNGRSSWRGSRYASLRYSGMNMKVTHVGPTTNAGILYCILQVNGTVIAPEPTYPVQTMNKSIALIDMYVGSTITSATSRH